MITIAATKTMPANLWAVSWVVYAVTGINCGSIDAGATPKTGSVGWKSDVGIIVEVPDDTAPATVATIQGVLDDYLATAPPPEGAKPFAAPMPAPTPFEDAWYACKTDAERVQVLFTAARYGVANYPPEAELPPPPP